MRSQVPSKKNYIDKTKGNNPQIAIIRKIVNGTPVTSRKSFPYDLVNVRHVRSMYAVRCAA
jgi:hypothetical protein